MEKEDFIRKIKEKNELIDLLIEDGLNTMKKVIDLEEEQDLMLEINLKLKKEINKISLENKNLQRRCDVAVGGLDRCEIKLYITTDRIELFKTFLYYIRLEPWYKIFSLRKRISKFYEENEIPKFN